MGTTTKVFELIPLNWEALAAIATFFAVIFAFYQHRSYLKQEEKKIKRDVAKEIVIPIRKRLSEFLNYSLSDNRYYRSFWQDLEKLKREFPFQYQSLEPDIRQLTEDFNIRFRRFGHLSMQLQPQFLKIISECLKNFLDQNKISYQLNSEIDPPSMDDYANAHWRCSVGGKERSVTLYALVMRNISFQKYLNERQKDVDLPDTTIGSIVFNIPEMRSVDLDKMQSNKLLSEIGLQITKEKDLRDYRKDWKNLHEAGQYLLIKFNSWLSF
ncbi:MAG: hypothetical protein KJI72_03075 [Patescibacteria group bacterium]|nr:hypothetical protein [Patescibacteria group bacterium]